MWTNCSWPAGAPSYRSGGAEIQPLFCSMPCALWGGFATALKKKHLLLLFSKDLSIHQASHPYRRVSLDKILYIFNFCTKMIYKLAQSRTLENKLSLFSDDVRVPRKSKRINWKSISINKISLKVIGNEVCSCLWKDILQSVKCSNISFLKKSFIIATQGTKFPGIYLIKKMGGLK